jgi:hypothetical protein
MHMSSKKTTVKISEPLLRDARKLAAREGITLRTLVERGLRHMISETKQNKPFKLRDASFEGLGLQADVQMLRGISCAI